MWQHEIIESLSEMRKIYKQNGVYTEKQEKWYQWFVKVLKNAPTLYFGMNEDYSAVYANKMGKSVESWHFPFNYFLFEYRHGDNGKFDADWQEVSSKRANLFYVVDTEQSMITESNKQDLIRISNDFGLKKDVSDIKFFYFFSFCYFDKYKKWEPSTICFFASTETKYSKPLICPFFGATWEQFDSDWIDTSLKEAGTEIGFSAILLDFLNCRNVVTEDVTPPEKLNKSRIRKNKEPLCTYKILKVVKGVPKIKYTNTSNPWGKPVSGAICAQHICRGHFKEYTEDAPLFGKYTGRFWWQPQVRGHAKNGVVVKDYEIVKE